MKKKLFTFAFFVHIVIYGQQQTSTDSLYEPLIPIRKQQLIKDVDVIFNTRSAFDNSFSGGTYENSRFNVNQFRLEIKGRIHEKVYFRFRDRYTSSTNPGSLDNISQTTDMAFIGVDIAPKTSIMAGRIYTDWGGYEFDLNPIEVLEYNDLLNNAEVFLTGVGITHHLNNKNTFSFQVLNSRAKIFDDVYTNRVPPGTVQAKAPLAFVGNWRGSFFDRKFETTYSFSHFIEANNKVTNYLAIGNKYHNKDFTLMYDFHYSNEGLDSRFIVSDLIKDAHPYLAENVTYLAHWVRMEYRVAPKFNLVLSLMTNSANWHSNPDSNAPSKLYTSYGYIPTIEYYPFNDMDLKFYIAYVGRDYNFTNYAKEALGQSDYSRGRLSIGLIAPLLVL